MLLQQERYRTNATIHIDRIRILQVLSNPIDNALKFTPAAGRVDVREEPYGNHLRSTTDPQSRKANRRKSSIPTFRRPATPEVAPISALTIGRRIVDTETKSALSLMGSPIM
jgi:signal transduction histidine kinase